jgi:hypothetical protein
MLRQKSRREFLKASSLAAIGALGAPGIVRAANELIRREPRKGWEFGYEA